jgi:bifunctional non-homologous end joining protein LigD
MPGTHTDRLAKYWSKRDFDKTPEPRGVRARAGKALSFVIQKHAATRLHYDFRLELDGVLLSWAVPKGPSFDPKDKRMAVRTEDHPLSYADFEGTIPPGQYGAGQVIVWDRGTWRAIGDPHEGLAAGKLVFELEGDKLSGAWELIRIQKPGERQETWLLFKKRDDHARPHEEFDVVTAWPDSVISAKRIDAPVPAARASKATKAIKATKPATPSDAQKPARKSATARTKEAALPPAAALPETLSPQLATLATGVPPTGEWLFEVKYDGYRVMTRIEDGEPRLITRGGHDWTAKLPQLAKSLRGLGLRSGWLDGELVVLNDEGIPDFNALQNSFDRARTERIVYFLFDLPFLEGRDLREVPLRQRREALAQVVEARGDERVRFSANFEADPASILQSACQMKLEGVIAKRADAPYESRRSNNWLKLKCQLRQEFVIAGYTARRGVDGEVGSLLLGVHDEAGRLLPVGSVGTGWDTATTRELWKTLHPLTTEACPFDGGKSPKQGRWSRRTAGSERWVKPTRIAEVSFGEWTPDGQIRHAVFVSLRTDKPARQITRERAVDPAPRSARAAKAEPAAARSAAARVKRARSSDGIRVSNPDRVIDPSTGTTKLDLVRYYESVADWMLPHLKGRPCSFVRGPSGIGGELFFQKHTGKLKLTAVQQLDPALWPGHEALMEVGTAEGLASAAQMNVIEFHTWNTMARHIDKPDRIVFDIDPGEGVGWSMIQDAAVLTHALLEELGLRAWLKTSGGKGLHVVVPIAPRQDWDTVKDFSQAVVQHLADQIPDRFVAKSGPANRVGKIFVDYLRNGHGATTAVAFSARARPGLGVSMPVTWEDLPSLKSGAHWTVATAREHLSFLKADPWAEYFKTRQALGPAIKRLGKPAKPAAKRRG